MFDMKKFAAFLVGKRREKNITQGQLADMVGVTHQAVSKWERGETMPELSKLSDLSNALDVPTEDFVAAMHSADDEEKKLSCLDNEYYALPDKTLVGDVYALAPFLSRQTLTTAITELTLSKGSGISSMLFKFADEEILREVALTVFSIETDVGRIHLLPYLPQNEVSKLILNRYSSGGVNAILPLLPYAKEKEVVDMIFKSVVSTAGNWHPFMKILPSILPEVVVENGIDYAIEYGMGSFHNWWKLLGSVNTANIFIGYCRHFSHSFSAWSDIAPYLRYADTNLMVAELEKMKADGYDFNMTVNYAQMKALPPPIAEKLTEYGMKADVEHFDRVNFTGSVQNNWNGRNDADEFEDRISELEDRIEDLENMIEDLESTVEDLESRLDELED